MAGVGQSVACEGALAAALSSAGSAWLGLYLARDGKLWRPRLLAVHIAPDITSATPVLQRDVYKVLGSFLWPASETGLAHINGGLNRRGCKLTTPGQELSVSLSTGSGSC